jgi:polyisoprenoid-binding protein YceI
MKTFWTFALSSLVGLLAALPSFAETMTYVITPGNNNEVVFVSKAVGETFDGRTDQISGNFSCDLDDLNQPVSGSIEVDVESLDTGIKLRNNHMLKNHLHPEEFPKMTFDLEELTECPDMIKAGETHAMKATGNFTCHGVTNAINADLTITRGNDGSLRVKAEWVVNLSDYDIPRPQFLIVKLAEDQDVSATFTATPK